MTKLEKDKTGSYYTSGYTLPIKQQYFNAKCIINFCKNMSKYKWTEKSICALLGNMSFESTLNPKLGETGGSGYGLVQWTPKSKLLNRAKAIGRYSSYDTIYTQMKVLDSDLEKEWIKTSDYPITIDDFVKDTSHDINWLTGAFLKNYERPQDQSQSNINLRTNGDSDGHIGSNQFANHFNFDDFTEESGSINDMLKWCKKIADDDSYLYKLGSAHGVSFETYTGKYFDCSSFVSFGLYNGGYDLKTQFTTANQKSELKELGFKIINFKNKSQLKKGDILFYNVNGHGHTEIVYCVEPLQLVGATTDDNPIPEQISIHNFYESEWQYIARPNNDDGGGSGGKERYFKINRKRMTFVYPKIR